ncbi:LEA_2 domain-containing protein [Psidium guajava]|nr:LEA_2 domain-containing protein [Psidium guajava]
MTRKAVPSSPHNALRFALTAITVLLLLAGITALVVYLVYRPERPRSPLSVLQFTASTPRRRPSSLRHHAVHRSSSGTPTGGFAIYYDRLSSLCLVPEPGDNPTVITAAALPREPEHGGAVPVRGGEAVPTAVEVGNGLRWTRRMGGGAEGVVWGVPLLASPPCKVDV